MFSELDNLGVFDPTINRARVRSLFKAELQRLTECVFEIHREIVIDLELQYNLPHLQVTLFRYG